MQQHMLNGCIVSHKQHNVLIITKHTLSETRYQDIITRHGTTGRGRRGEKGKSNLRGAQKTQALSLGAHVFVQSSFMSRHVLRLVSFTYVSASCGRSRPPTQPSLTSRISRDA